MSEDRARREIRRRHHVIPRAIQLGFCDDEEALTCRWRTGMEKNLRVTNSAVFKDFYSFDSGTGPDDSVEVWLSDVEAPFHDLLSDIKGGYTKALREHDVIANYFAAGLLRTPATRSYMEQIDHRVGGWAALAYRHAEGHLDLRGIGRDELTRLAAIASDALRRQQRPRDVARSRLRTMVRTQNELRDQLAQYTFSLEHTTQSHLVLGDAMVTVAPPEADGWHGILPTGAPVYLPLTPTSALAGYPPTAPLLGTPQPDQLAPLLNRLTVQQAANAVYRHPKTPFPDAPFSSAGPLLPEPSVTFSLTGQPGGGSPEPTYPTPTNQAVRDLLHALGADS